MQENKVFLDRLDQSTIFGDESMKKAAARANADRGTQSSKVAEVVRDQKNPAVIRTTEDNASNNPQEQE